VPLLLLLLLLLQCRLLNYGRRAYPQGDAYM
jgi:hypothetical protein